jgi:hypothetical protein
MVRKKKEKNYVFFSALHRQYRTGTELESLEQSLLGMGD